MRATSLFLSFCVVMTACGSRSTPSDGGAHDGAISSDAKLDTISDQSNEDGQADIGESDLQRPDALVDGATGPVCDPMHAVCESTPPLCRTGETVSIVNGCWGECVPVTECIDLPDRPNCNLQEVLCDAPTPYCPEGYVPTSDGFCYGACVSWRVCACTSDTVEEACPPPAEVCYGSGYCGQLV